MEYLYVKYLGKEHLIPAVASLLVTKGLWDFKSWLKIEDGKANQATHDLLEASSAPKDVVPPECLALVSALEGAEADVDEATCAEQMRTILSAVHLSYGTLVNEPETLLRCSKGMAGPNGALWTRFTVQYNLYAGSIIALGSDEHRADLIKAQHEGTLGCFAFTEKGAGVMSGAGMETTAVYNAKTDSFVINSPTASSSKNWISQGCYAEKAVILADLTIDGKSYGGHLFWAPIATLSSGKKGKLERPKPLPGVTINSLPKKTALLGLDNAEIMFSKFVVPRSALLSRFGGLVGSGKDVVYEARLPKGVPRMLDLLISRLLTGRIVLSEATLSHVLVRIRSSWKYCCNRELWRFRQPKGKMMSDMPLIRGAFRDYSRCTAIVQCFVENTREKVADAIRNQVFPHDLIEATCMSKFVGTGFSVDCISVIRKMLGAQAMFVNSTLGDETFLPYATSAAEGDNTIMELKVVQDIVRGRTSKVPVGLMASLALDSRGRKACGIYLERFARAMVLQARAMEDGQLLRDIAWARAHMRVIQVWLATNKEDSSKIEWLESYDRVLMNFPVPVQV